MTMIITTTMITAMAMGELAMADLFLDDFIVKALMAGLMIAAISGVVGCFIVWRRMAYFGDSLAHSALLGIAIGLISGLGMTVSILMIAFVFAGLLLWLQHRRVMATDALLGILAHGGLSSAVVLIALARIPIDLHGLLFGDILTVTSGDLVVIAGGGAAILAALGLFWQRLLLMTINEDLAKAEGVNTFFMQLIFLILIAVTVAISVRMVGVLLITSMLIIPAATARQFAATPAGMAGMAAIVGIMAVLSGMTFSLAADTPTGPSMVLCLAGLFTASLLISRLLIPRKVLAGGQEESSQDIS
jgi:zinc transport system permease protein